MNLTVGRFLQLVNADVSKLESPSSRAQTMIFTQLGDPGKEYSFTVNISSNGVSVPFSSPTHSSFFGSTAREEETTYALVRSAMAHQPVAKVR